MSSNPDRSGLSASELALQLREFLAEHHPGRTPRSTSPLAAAERLVFQKAWQATLAEHGWAAPGWPRRWGGMGLPLRLQAVHHRELAVARTPVAPSRIGGIVGPALLGYGTVPQLERFMGPLIRADELWCQGFSEPDAGSDLASLRTRAVPDGSDYRLTGRKVWTSGAHFADWMLCLARTGPAGSGAVGITALVVDMHAPGVTARPLRDMTGGAHFAEVELDGVVVPATNRIGAENTGWAVARATLGHERSTSLASSGMRYRRVTGDLLELARRRGRNVDAYDRDALARAVTGARLLEWSGQRVLARVLEGGEPGPLASVIRLQHALFEQGLHELATDLLGAQGALAPADEHLTAGGKHDGAWLRGFLRTRASTIGAGTAEIQRNTIADRVLGLAEVGR
jgi:alkylation response protein AidB-like acyl-CoA dehydrogenase